MRGPDNIDWNNETWDAQRLVREYVSLAAEDFRRKPMKDLVWSDQIFFQRLIAVIHAFVGDIIPETDIPYDYTSAVFGQGGIGNLEILEKSPIDATDREAILQWLIQYRNQTFHTPQTEQDFTWSPRERSQIIHILLMQRLETQKCLEANSGWLESTKAGAMAINACKSLYNPHLRQANEQLDRIIALLLGSSFKGTFNVTELIENHRYPTATDGEIYDWQIDNY